MQGHLRNLVEVRDFASSRKVLFYGPFHGALSRQRLLFMATTEAEAIVALARNRSGLLLITRKLDQGAGLQLVERARSVVDDIRKIVLCDRDHDDLVAADHSSADAVIGEQELGTEQQDLTAMPLQAGGAEKGGAPQPAPPVPSETVNPSAAGPPTPHPPAPRQGLPPAATKPTRRQAGGADPAPRLHNPTPSPGWLPAAAKPTCRQAGGVPQPAANRQTTT